MVINLGSKKFNLPFSEALFLSNPKTDSFKSLPLAKLINCRNAQSKGEQDGIRVFSADFSFISVLDNCLQFRQLVNSSNRDERKVADRLLKVSSAVHMSRQSP